MHHQEQAEDPQRAVPQGRGAPNNCKVFDYKVTGSTVTWSMKCEGPEAMSGTGEITYGEYLRRCHEDGTSGSDHDDEVCGERLGDCVK